VLGVGYHRFLILTPDNPADFKDNPRFTTPQGRSNIATVSGQPLNENCNPICGNLTSKPNTDLDSEVLGKVTIEPPKESLSDTEFINLILKAESLYKNELKYAGIPELSFGGYNSNSFVRGILGSVGIQQLTNLRGFAPDIQAFGFNKPISLSPVLVSGGSRNQSSQSGTVFKSEDGRSVLI
jgi:hypothetical protein